MHPVKKLGFPGRTLPRPPGRNVYLDTQRVVECLKNLAEGFNVPVL